MKLLRIIPLFILLGIVGTAIWGSATSMGVNGGTLEAGSANVVQCDDSGVGAVWRTAWNKTSDQLVLHGVTVVGIDSDCAGKYIEVVVTDKDGNKLDNVKTTVPPAPDTNVRLEFTKCATFDDQANCEPPVERVHDIHIVIHD